jgi:rhamnose utilization protein RhaD (predicted bifunctional aldolase and dehydrogenase)
MDRRKLARIWERSYPGDAAARESAVLADIMAARAPGEEEKRPSVETLLHDLLPFAYVVHLHPALVNGLTCSRRGEELAAEFFGGAILWIPSVNPGYVLSRTVREAMAVYTRDKGRAPDIILLQNHGVFAGAGTPEAAGQRYQFLMDTVRVRVKRRADMAGGRSRKLGPLGSSDKLGQFLAVAAGAPVAVSFLDNWEIEKLVQDRRAFEPVSGAFTPDHIVYAGSDPLFIEAPPHGGPSEEAVAASWQAHTAKTGRAPKIVAVERLGVFGIGPTEKAAGLALELFRDSIQVAAYAESFGGGRFMDQDQIDFINNWEVEQYRAAVSF